MKKKLMWIIPVLLIVVALSGLGIAGLLFYFDTPQFSAKDLPFGLQWGMSKDDVEHQIYHERGYIPRVEDNNHLIYAEIRVDGCLMHLFTYFTEDKLDSIHLYIYEGKTMNLDMMEKKIKRIYQKEKLLEIITTYGLYAYITDESVVSIHKMDTLSIDFYDIEPYRELLEDLMQESEQTGQRTFYLDEYHSRIK